MSAVLHNFCTKAMLQVLPTASNLVRWKRITDPSCPLCASNIPQTNKHVLSNCGSARALNRYTIRHNDVLKLIVFWLRSVLSNNKTAYADLNDATLRSLPVCDLFVGCRPDIAVVSDKYIHTWKLTECNASNHVLTNRINIVI